MALDPRVARFLEALSASRLRSPLQASVEERRHGLADLMNLGGPKAAMEGIEDGTVPAARGSLRIRRYIPHQTTHPGPGLIYFHGGGLIAGDLDTHDGIARSLAAASHCRVLSVDYPLAPENPFPAALEEAGAAVRHIAANSLQFGIAEKRLGLCGDSAGATLAAATLNALGRDGRQLIALQVLLCPILDHSRRSASRNLYASGFLLDQETLDHDLRHYLRTGTDVADPRISPLRAAAVATLPRTLIHAAEFDPLRDEAREYYDALSRAQVDVSYTCHPGMIHLFYGLGAVVPYAADAWTQIGGEIQAALGS